MAYSHQEKNYTKFKNILAITTILFLKFNKITIHSTRGITHYNKISLLFNGK